MGYNGSVRDPFRLPAPDGRTYFDLLNPPRSLVPLYEAIARYIALFEAEARAATYPALRLYWQGWKTKFEFVLLELSRDMEISARQAAIVADSAAHGFIKSTQVRPDTSKQRHMEDNLFSRHTPTASRLDLGVVGLFDVTILDQTRAGGGRAGGVYWDAQEFGTDAHVGRTVRGFFMPGHVRPDPNQFRDHPEFQAVKRVKSRMTIKKRIEERGFLRRGVEAAGRRRQVMVRAAGDKVIVAVRQYKASVPPPPPRAARIRRRR